MNEERGAEMPKQPEKLVYRQTESGAYNSKPKLKDVMYELGLSGEEENNWRRDAADDGFGEYITNVNRAVKLCRERGANTKEEIQQILNDAEEELV